MLVAHFQLVNIDFMLPSFVKEVEVKDCLNLLAIGVIIVHKGLTDAVILFR